MNVKVSFSENDSTFSAKYNDVQVMKGGYYLPSVSLGGVLSWEASEPGMPIVPNSNIRGPQGIPGVPGERGEPGEDGYSPVRGKDYWTNVDKQEIVDAVLVALPAAEGGSF